MSNKLNHKVYDQTLLEVDKALEAKNKLEKKRNYLGMSQIGEECRRKLFYSFRGVCKREISASGIKAIEDGFMQEDKMAERLKMLPYIELHTVDDTTGNQIGFYLLLDHFRGHCDGIIRGIKEAPITWHIWEHKSVNVKKFEKIISIREKDGEKNTLKLWDEIYYAQAQIYMHCSKLERHFLTVTSPGGRDYTSVRTDYNKKEAEGIIEKAKVIIFDNWTIPAKLSENREFFKCKWCEFQGVCHDNDIPDVNCKTCRYREPVKDGKNNCLLSENEIDDTTLNAGCNSHVFNPALINVKLIEHQQDGCLYKTENGIVFSNTNIIGLPDLSKNVDYIFTSKELRNDIKNINNITKSGIKIKKQVDGEFVNNQKAWNQNIDPRLKGI